jgi:predicted nuclease with TOPRIM domain
MNFDLLFSGILAGGVIAGGLAWLINKIVGYSDLKREVKGLKDDIKELRGDHTVLLNKINGLEGSIDRLSGSFDTMLRFVAKRAETEIADKDMIDHKKGRRQ